MTDDIEVLSGVVHPWHVDSLGHMNSRWYAHLLDDASFQFWARQGLGHKHLVETFGVVTVTASSKIDYLRELLAGDCYIVSGGAVKIGTKSVTLEFSVIGMATGVVHARFTTVEVFVGSQTHQSVPIPETIRNIILPRHF